MIDCHNCRYFVKRESKCLLSYDTGPEREMIRNGLAGWCEQGKPFEQQPGEKWDSFAKSEKDELEKMSPMGRHTFLHGVWKLFGTLGTKQGHSSHKPPKNP